MAGIMYRGLLSPAAGGGGGGGSLPTSGLLAHWDAALGVTQVGGAVSQWDDQSGNGKHLTQATGGRQPTYVASVQNGLPGILFPSGTGLAFPTLSGVKAMLYVVKYPTSTFSNNSVLQSGSIGGDAAIYGGSGTAQWAAFPTGIATYRRNGASRATNETISPLNTAHYIYIDSSLFAYGYTGEVMGNWTDYLNNWTGHILECALWNAQLSAPNIASVESYVASKFAI